MLKNNLLKVSLLILTLALSCSSNKKKETVDKESKHLAKKITVQNEPHRYGGWYCPDNLNTFPAVNLKDWKQVPAVSKKLPTKEDVEKGNSLIFVDTEKYPNAKALDINLPKLAKVFNWSSNREELIIVIQAVKVQEDSIVGYRFLNGGNGSKRLNEIEFLNEEEVADLKDKQFINKSIRINTNQDKVWETLTKNKYRKDLQATFDKSFTLNLDWREKTNFNYKYMNSGYAVAQFADKHFGCFYVQNDYKDNSYTEKIILLEDEFSKTTEMKISMGPFDADFEKQNKIIDTWMQKVKTLTENNNK